MKYSEYIFVELSVTEAFPCKTLSTGADYVNVEMDPTSELEARELIKSRGMRIVGWYHSHPVFQPDPSGRDIENQTNYQTLLRDEETEIEPFVGMIVGPYDVRMPTDESLISTIISVSLLTRYLDWFYVRNTAEVKSQPMCLKHEVQEDTVSKDIEDKMVQHIT